MNIISPAVLANIDTGEYRVRGPVVRAFDTNGMGELVPVEFNRLADSNKFTLPNGHCGQVYAEHVVPD